MDNNEIYQEKDLQTLLLEQTELLQKQHKTMKIQMIAVTSLLLVLVIIFLVLSAKITGTLNELNVAIGEITSLSQEINTLLEESRLTELLQNANDLIKESGESLTDAIDGIKTALQKVNAVDFDSLNTAITDLKRIVEPLAKLFGK